MLHTIKNGDISITVSELGAELNSIVYAGKELLWQGDIKWWTGRAPILFPFVGKLKDGAYVHRGKRYSIKNNHGFARRSEFALISKTESTIALSLCDSDETKKLYPFDFELIVEYELSGRSVHTCIYVANKSSGDMFFSVGGHPALNCPLDPGEAFEDYEIVFDKKETAGVHVIDENGLVSRCTAPFLNKSNKIPLDYALFAKHGTLVFSDLKSTAATLRSRKTGAGIKMNFAGFPYFAVWTKPGAPFVCLEPWCGVDDAPESTGKLSDKTGIVKLSGDSDYTRAFSIAPIA